MLNLRRLATPLALFTTLGLAACSTLPAPSPDLSSVAALGPEKGVLAKRREFADAATLATVQQVHIAAVQVGDFKGAAKRPEKDLARVANAAARATCRQLARRFDIVGAPGPGVLDVRIRLTEVRATDGDIATASAMLPIRAPLGLGGLTAEAEAFADAGAPAAAMVWSRRADILSSGRASAVGDAYDFASEFGAEFGRLLTRSARKGDEGATRPAAVDRNAACAQYGDTRFAADLLYFFGLPVSPKLTEKRAPAQLEAPR